MLYGNASKGAIFATTLVMPTIASLMTSLRLYARLGVSKNAGRDDAFIIAAVVRWNDGTARCGLIYRSCSLGQLP